MLTSKTLTGMDINRSLEPLDFRLGPKTFERKGKKVRCPSLLWSDWADVQVDLHLSLPQRCAATWQNQQSECVPSEDSDQPGHPPSLIRVFAVRTKKPWVLSYLLSAQRRLWSDWVDAQAAVSLRQAHIHFVGFVMSWLKSFCWFCGIVAHLILLFLSLGTCSFITEPRHEKTRLWDFRPGMTPTSLPHNWN